MKVTTGVFWVVRGEILFDRRDVDLDETRDFIDHPLSHFDLWDIVRKGRFRTADFATYPRGRLLYSVKEGRYRLYLDRCIKQNAIDDIVAIYGLAADGFDMLRDEHYRCDRCLRRAPFPKSFD